jgi:Protein of unknown function (DUF3551)
VCVVLCPRHICLKGKTVMRFLLIAVTLALAAEAHAQEYSSSGYCDPWCSRSGGSGCSYHTFQQCSESTSGDRTTCYPNPFIYQCSRIGQSAADRGGWSAFGRAHSPKPAH